jgi:isoleucyl-tRNA synthetase
VSSIYKNLSSEDLKFSKDNPSFNSEKPKSPSLLGVKIAIALSFILSLTGLAGAGYLYQELNAERRQRQALEAAQIQIQEKASALQKNTKNYQEQISKLTDQVRTAYKERESVTKELAARKVEIAEIQIQLQELEEKNQALSDESSLIRRQLESDAPETETAFAEGEASPFEAVSADLTEKPAAAAAASGPVAAAAAVAKKETASAPSAAPVKKPQVLTVNRKFNFVVVSLGMQDGIKMADTLLIQRGNKDIATVQVEKLYSNFAAAAITQESKKDPVKEGDAVVRPEN